MSYSDSVSVSDSPERAPRVGLRGGRNRKYTLAEKFDARVAVGAPDACWPCSGSQLHSGHVQISIGSATDRPYVRVRAHVFAWERANKRRVPYGMVVMHSCDNPPCCNPRHLSIGTQKQNIVDSIQKGRYNAFGRQRLDAAKVRLIRAQLAAGRIHKDIARQFNVTRSAIGAIARGETWGHVPFVVGAGECPDRLAPVAALPQQLPNLILERVPSVQLVIRGEVA